MLQVNLGEQHEVLYDSKKFHLVFRQRKLLGAEQLSFLAMKAGCEYKDGKFIWSWANVPTAVQKVPIVSHRIAFLHYLKLYGFDTTDGSTVEALSPENALWQFSTNRIDSLN